MVVVGTDSLHCILYDCSFRSFPRERIELATAVSCAIHTSTPSALLPLRKFYDTNWCDMGQHWVVCDVTRLSAIWYDCEFIGEKEDSMGSLVRNVIAECIRTVWGFVMGKFHIISRQVSLRTCTYNLLSLRDDDLSVTEHVCCTFVAPSCACHPTDQKERFTWL
jgi:hypothetical protein